MLDLQDTAYSRLHQTRMDRLDKERCRPHLPQPTIWAKSPGLLSIGAHRSGETSGARP